MFPALCVFQNRTFDRQSGAGGASAAENRQSSGFYTPEYRELYQRRKETIERVFADAKEKHAMRYTQYRGLAQVSNWVKLKFAAMNLKKLARWLCQESLASLCILLLWPLHDPNPAYA